MAKSKREKRVREKKCEALIKRLAMKLGGTLPQKSKKLKKHFRNAAERLEGPLKTELLQNEAKYISLYLLIVAKSTDSKEGITTNRCTALNSEKNAYPFNLYKKDQEHKDLVENIKCKDIKLSWKECHCLLSQTWSTPDVAPTILKHMKLKGASACWLEEVRLLITALIGKTKPAKLQHAMSIMLSALSAHREELLSDNGKKLKTNLETIKELIVYFHMKYQQCQAFSNPNYNDLMAAILSIFVEMVIQCDEEEPKGKLTPFVCMVLNNHNCLDVLLQMDLQEAHVAYLRPLWKKIFSLLTKETLKAPDVYVKYMCAIRMVSKLTKELEFMEMALTVPAQEGFIEWITEQDEDLLEETPLTSKSKGLEVTQFILKEASDDDIEGLLNILTTGAVEEAEETTVSNVDADHEESGSLYTVDRTPDDIVPTERGNQDVFFIDKQSSKKATGGHKYRVAGNEDEDHLEVGDEGEGLIEMTSDEESERMEALEVKEREDIMLLTDEDNSDSEGNVGILEEPGEYKVKEDNLKGVNVDVDDQSEEEEELMEKTDDDESDREEHEEIHNDEEDESDREEHEEIHNDEEDESENEEEVEVVTGAEEIQSVEHEQRKESTQSQEDETKNEEIDDVSDRESREKEHINESSDTETSYPMKRKANTKYGFHVEGVEDDDVRASVALTQFQTKQNFALSQRTRSHSETLGLSNVTDTYHRTRRMSENISSPLDITRKTKLASPKKHCFKPTSPVKGSPKRHVSHSSKAPVDCVPTSAVMGSPAKAVKGRKVTPVKGTPEKSVNGTVASVIRETRTSPGKTSPVKGMPALPFNVTPSKSVKDIQASPLKDTQKNPGNDTPASPEKGIQTLPCKVTPLKSVKDIPASPVKDTQRKPVKDIAASPVKGTSTLPVKGTSTWSVKDEVISPVKGTPRKRPSGSPTSNERVSPKKPFLPTECQMDSPSKRPRVQKSVGAQNLEGQKKLSRVEQILSEEATPLRRSRRISAGSATSEDDCRSSIFTCSKSKVEDDYQRSAFSGLPQAAAIYTKSPTTTRTPAPPVRSSPRLRRKLKETPTKVTSAKKNSTGLPKTPQTPRPSSKRDDNKRTELFKKDCVKLEFVDSDEEAELKDPKPVGLTPSPKVFRLLNRTPKGSVADSPKAKTKRTPRKC